jgi:hypothetical protein
MEPSKYTLPALSKRDHDAVVAILIRHIRAWYDRQHKLELKAKIEKEIPELNTQIQNCEAGLRAFGLDPEKEEVWTAIRTTFNEEVRRATAINSDDHQQPQLSLTPASGRPDEQPSARVQDLILERLGVVFPAGSKAAPIREYVEKRLGRSVHSKTVGMTLYRLLNKQLVSRKGHTWFFVPQDAETKDPAGETAGPEASS